jgi:hypothetical protein
LKHGFAAAILAAVLSAFAVVDAHADAASATPPMTKEDRAWCYMAGLAIEHAGVAQSRTAAGAQSGLKVMLAGEKLANAFNAQQEVTDEELEPLLEMPLSELVTKVRALCAPNFPDIPTN